MARIRDYRAVLRAIGRKPVPQNIRTSRKPGDVEIVRDHQTGEHVLHRYDEQVAA